MEPTGSLSFEAITLKSPPGCRLLRFQKLVCGEPNIASDLTQQSG